MKNLLMMTLFFSLSSFGNECLEYAKTQDFLQAGYETDLLNHLCKTGNKAAAECFKKVDELANTSGNAVYNVIAYQRSSVLVCKNASSNNPFGAIDCLEEIEKQELDLPYERVNQVLCAGARSSAPIQCFKRNFKGFGSLDVALKCSDTRFSESEKDYFQI